MVRCINKNGNLTSELVIGKVYRCVRDDDCSFGDGYIKIEGLDSNWSTYQFEVVGRFKKEIKKFGIALFMESIEK